VQGSLGETRYDVIIRANLRNSIIMKTSRVCESALLFVTVFLQGLYAQSPQPTVQIPKGFQIYYEVGPPPPITSLDTFDSEKKTRTVAAEKGMITYSAELTDSEKLSIYAAVQSNDLLSIKDDFPNSPTWRIDPGTAGRLRLTIDGRTKEIRFNLAYGCPGVSSDTGTGSELSIYFEQLAQARGMPPCVSDPEWFRFNKVRVVIDGILKAKDDQQHISHRLSW